MKRISIVGGIFLMLASATNVAAAPKSLCEDNEKLFWNCPVKEKNKIASICGSKDLSSTEGYIQYRYGTTKAVELKFPATHERSQKKLMYARYTRPMVTYLRVRFKNSGYEYAMEDSNDDTEGLDPEEKKAANGSWLTVTTPKAVEKRMRCEEDTRGSLMELEDILPNEDFLK